MHPAPDHRITEHAVANAIIKIVLVYAAFAALWILLSGQLVAFAFSDPRHIVIAETIKGWVFVAVTSLLLTLLVRRYMNQLAAQKGELELSEERWKLALEGAGEGVWDVNVQTGESLYSKRWKAMLGYEDSEIANRRDEWERRVHPDDMPAVRHAMADYQQGSVNDFTSEYRMQCKDGSWKWILARGMVATRTADGKPLRLIGTHSDITQSRAAIAALHASEELFRLITENIHDLVALVDVRGRRIYNSPSYHAYFSDDDLTPGVDSLRQIHPEDHDRIEAIFKETVATGSGQRAEFRFILKDGSTRDIESQGSVIRDAAGNVEKVLIVSRDISERKTIDRALRESEERFRTLADSAPMAIWVAGTDKGCYWFNKTWLDFTGRSMEQEFGNGWAEGVHPDDLVACMEHYETCFEARRRFEMEYRLRNHRGEYRWMLDTGTPRLDTEGVFSGFVGTMMDITERRAVEQELQLQARVDYLTGLFNRRHFIEQGELELSRALRYSKQLSAFMIDIDYFKQVNDTHGHRAGDMVLQALSQICKEALRDVDLIGRMGGEEFAVLLPETSHEKAAEVAERLRETIAATPIVIETGLPLHITVSIGVTTLTGKDSNIDMLLNQADTALYQAKETGRNRICGAP
jgi:diguanylate cyclase (GGDEF)-like protein/PAS domain S-box-containing protein